MLLFHKYFSNLVALAADIEAVFGVSNADTAEIVVFYRSVFVNDDATPAASS